MEEIQRGNPKATWGKQTLLMDNGLLLEAAYGQWIAARRCLWTMDCCLWKQCVENGLLFRTWIEMDIWLFDMVTLIFDSYLAKE